MEAKSEKRGGVAPLADVLARFLRANRLDKRLDEQSVLAAWRVALGERLAGQARALRYRNGELSVEVASATLLQELKNFTGEDYRQAANAALGAERIRRLSFQPRR